MGRYLDLLEEARSDIQKLLARNARPGTMGLETERIDERKFVRMFGDKVKRVRYSRRVDMVGLMVLGANTGFWVTRDPSTSRRKCRLVNVAANGEIEVTQRYLLLKDKDSMSNLQRGLLRYVQ